VGKSNNLELGKKNAHMTGNGRTIRHLPTERKKRVSSFSGVGGWGGGLLDWGGVSTQGSPGEIKPVC